MLKGNKILLREVRSKDYETLQNLRNNLDIQYLLLSRPRMNTEAKVKEWIDSFMKKDFNIFFIIAEQDNNSAVGYIQLSNVDIVSGHGELGIIIHPSYQGKSFASEAIQLLEQYATNTYNLRKIHLKVLRDNHRAVRAYEKVGFFKIGVYEKHFFYNKNYIDVLLMEKFI